MAQSLEKVLVQHYFQQSAQALLGDADGCLVVPRHQ